MVSEHKVCKIPCVSTKLEAANIILEFVKNTVNYLGQGTKLAAKFAEATKKRKSKSRVYQF